MFKNRIAKIIAEVTGFTDPNVEFTSDPQFGDYTTNIAMIDRSQIAVHGSPRKVAEQIVSKLLSSRLVVELCDRIEVAGPGFINFWLKKDVLVSNLIQIDSAKEKYGSSNSFKGKKIMFEFAHPNTHKAFHIGHLRNITTGETLSRLQQFVGAEVIRANYQGDVGLHIAKALYGIKITGFSDPININKRAEYLGKVYAAGATAYEEDEKAKEEIHLINGKIYDKSDIEINKLYNETRQWSLDYFASIYKRVYTIFDRLYFESECAESGKKIAEKALADGILRESDGAVIFPGSEYDLHDRVFISGKGVPTYEGKDLGLARLQLDEYDPQMIIHVLGPEQLGYTSVLFKALELIFPEIKGRELHLPYGWVKLKEGKMSSRTGNVVLGEDILNEAKEKIIQSYKTDPIVAEMIAVGAVKYSFLKTGLAQEISFDLKESISLEGNSGPYIQYTIARCNSVIQKAPSFKGEPLQGINTETLDTQELTVIRLLIRFSEVIEASATTYSPNILCNYLYELAQKFNSFYNSNKIIGSDNENFRLAITAATGQVLKNGLNLLGIQAPERM